MDKKNTPPGWTNRMEERYQKRAALIVADGQQCTREFAMVRRHLMKAKGYRGFGVHAWVKSTWRSYGKPAAHYFHRNTG